MLDILTTSVHVTLQSANAKTVVWGLYQKGKTIPIQGLLAIASIQYQIQNTVGIVASIVKIPNIGRNCYIFATENCESICRRQSPLQILNTKFGTIPLKNVTKIGGTILWALQKNVDLQRQCSATRGRTQYKLQIPNVRQFRWNKRKKRRNTAYSNFALFGDCSKTRTYTDIVLPPQVEPVSNSKKRMELYVECSATRSRSHYAQPATNFRQSVGTTGKHGPKQTIF